MQYSTERQAITAYRADMDKILSPLDPKASLNLASHLVAKMELMVAAGLLPPDALLAALCK